MTDAQLLREGLVWTQRLLGVALLLQTIELIQLRRVFRDDGIWSWSILREDQRDLPAPLRWSFGVLHPYPAFIGLLVVRLVLAALLSCGVSTTAPALLLSQIIINARFRGTFNGGSDYMSVVVLTALSVQAVFPGSASMARASMAYVCAQLILSYFIAGVVKLGRPEWRSGAALSRILATRRVGVSWSITPPRWCGWGAIAFECLFPCALLGPRVAVTLLAIGAVFHTANALLLGLNRFLFAWIAAYPALLYFSVVLGRS